MVNIGYVATPGGALRLAEWLLGMVAWCCVVSVKGYGHYSNLVYGVTVLIIFWLLGL